jgi:hypothetical protein
MRRQNINKAEIIFHNIYSTVFCRAGKTSNASVPAKNIALKFFLWKMLGTLRFAQPTKYRIINDKLI